MTRLGSPEEGASISSCPVCGASEQNHQAVLRLSCTSGDHVHVEAEDLDWGTVSGIPQSMVV
jgi:hypothetical protein